MNQRPFDDAHAIPLARPWFDDEEPRAAAAVVASGQLCQGPKTEQFEAEFAAKFAVKHAIAVSNGSVALGVALEAMGIGAGDEVIVQTRDTIYTYVVDTRPEDLVVGFDDVWVVSDQPVNPDPEGVGPAQHQRLLTLTTCAELFHTDERMVVFGHLESTRPS